METEKLIKMAIAYNGISLSELAKTCGFSIANFSQRLKRDSFKRADLNKIAAALGAKYETAFVFPDGTKI
jgi:transcriptional regulator with XRE-family HTH domain